MKIDGNKVKSTTGCGFHQSILGPQLILFFVSESNNNNNNTKEDKEHARQLQGKDSNLAPRGRQHLVLSAHGFLVSGLMNKPLRFWELISMA